MALGLDPTDVINVEINIGPIAVQGRNFGLLLVAGDSPVIDVIERIRYYTTLAAVGSDFGLSAPEYLAAAIYFGQKPQPNQLAIGRWAATATSAVLHGGYLSTAQQLLSNFTAITTGAFTITIDGTVKNVAGLNFSSATSLSQVAAIVQTALASAGSCSWTGSRFDIKSATAGASSSITYATAPGTGTDVSALLQLTNVLALIPVQGIVAESALNAALVFENISNGWYGLTYAASVALTNTDITNISALIEGSSPSRMFGYTTSLSAETAFPNTTTIGYQLSQLKYAQTTWCYSTSSPYAVCGLFGRAFSVDFTGSDTTITLKFKQIIGVAPETLTETQAAALKAIGGNVYVNYSNGSAIIQEGTMAGGRFFDEVHGLDWIQNYVQNGLFNLLYTSTTKVPQTDPGITRLLTQTEASLEQGVTNGLLAPGVWNAAGFGQLSQGDTLPKGFYTYAPPVASQAQADRDARKAPTIQAALKLAGAVHSGNVILNINR